MGRSMTYQRYIGDAALIVRDRLGGSDHRRGDRLSRAAISAASWKLASEA
jgi:hypothetical protein